MRISFLNPGKNRNDKLYQIQLEISGKVGKIIFGE